MALNLAFAWLLPVSVIRLHAEDLHAVGWGDGPWAMLTPVKVILLGWEWGVIKIWLVVKIAQPIKELTISLTEMDSSSLQFRLVQSWQRLLDPIWQWKLCENKMTYYCHQEGQERVEAKKLESGKSLRAVVNVIKLFWKNLGLFYRLYLVFSNKYMWKNVHPVYGAGIRTHNLQNMSLLP